MRVVKKMEMRGWILLAFMLVVTFLWYSFPITLGVFVGGIIALGDIWLMRTLFPRLIRKAKGVVLFVVQLAKYLFMAMFLGLLFFFKVVNPLATLVGLSLLVVVPLTGLFHLGREMGEV